VNTEFQQLGKWLMIAGGGIAVAGVMIFILGRRGLGGLFHLPGDAEYSGKNWRVYVPIATCIVLSILVTVILWLIHFFRR
jgi:hypothetical protein